MLPSPSLTSCRELHSAAKTNDCAGACASVAVFLPLSCQSSCHCHIFNACDATIFLPLLFLVAFVLTIAIAIGWLLLFWIDFLSCYFATALLSVMLLLLFCQWWCHCFCWCCHPFAACSTTVPLRLLLSVIAIASAAGWLLLVFAVVVAVFINDFAVAVVACHAATALLGCHHHSTHCSVSDTAALVLGIIITLLLAAGWLLLLSCSRSPLPTLQPPLSFALAIFAAYCTMVCRPLAALAACWSWRSHSCCCFFPAAAVALSCRCSCLLYRSLRMPHFCCCHCNHCRLIVNFLESSAMQMLCYCCCCSRYATADATLVCAAQCCCWPPPTLATCLLCRCDNFSSLLLHLKNMLSSLLLLCCRCCHHCRHRHHHHCFGLSTLDNNLSIS